MQIVHIFGMKGELINGNVGVSINNVGDVIAHHTGGVIMHDGPPHLDMTNIGGGLEKNCSTGGLSREGFKFITNKN